MNNIEAGSMDAILNSHGGDEKGLRERVTELERLVSEQQKEITSLKSSITDFIRRLGIIESRPHTAAGPARVPEVKAPPSRLSLALPPSTRPGTNSTRPVLSPKSAPAHPKKAPAPAGGESAPATARSPHRQSQVSSATSAAAAGDKKEEKEDKKESTTLKRPATARKAEPEKKTEKEKPHPTSAKDRPKATAAKGGKAGDKEKEPVIDKDEGTVKMWLRGRPLTFYAPTGTFDTEGAHTGAKDAPPQHLKLEWAYGYRGKDCRSNVYFLPTGEFVYFVAATVVLQNPTERTQRHYTGHSDDVKSIALHPDKVTVATGQVPGHDAKSKAHVRVWNSVNLNTLAVLGLEYFERGIAAVAFSRTDGGVHLAAIDESNEHVFSVWDWANSKKLADQKVSGDPVFSVEWSTQDANSLAACGKGGVFFLSFNNTSITKKQGIFDKFEKPKAVLGLTYSDNGDLLTGDTSGNICIWARGGVKATAAMTTVHEGGTFALLQFRGEFNGAAGSFVVSGGKDHKVSVHDLENPALPRVFELDVGEQYGSVRAITMGTGGTHQMLLGTGKDYILQGGLGEGAQFQPVVSGHAEELWGLASHPGRHQFLSAGYDKTIFLWDALTHAPLWSKEVNDPAHSAAFHPNGEVIAIGTKSARWLVIDAGTRDTVATFTDGNEQIECIEYSPDGNWVAVGSRDNFIYIYQVAENGRKYTRVGKCQGHSSFITHLDWSTDSKYVQSNSGDYENLFWMAETCKQVPSAANLRDVQFATTNCALSYSSFGLWQSGADGTDVNGCARAHKTPLLASADDFGKVNLFVYPTTTPHAGHHEYGGHSSHVTSVRFLFDDSRLLSAGGKDMAVLQWEVLPN